MQQLLVVLGESEASQMGPMMALRPQTTTAAETAHYIAGLAKELRLLAAKADLGFLAYLLAMVADDAEATAHRLGEEKPNNGA